MMNRNVMSLACSIQTEGTLQDRHGSLLCARNAFKGINVRCDLVYRGESVLPDDQRTSCRVMNETDRDDLCKPSLSLLAA